MIQLLPKVLMILLNYDSSALIVFKLQIHAKCYFITSSFILIHPVCKCDSRGRQIEEKLGDWCWLERSPCLLLTGSKTPSNWAWVRCESNGAINIDCSGNNIFRNRKTSNRNRKVKG